MNSSGSTAVSVRALLARIPWRMALLIFFGLIAGAAIAVAITGWALTPTLPSVSGLADTQLTVPLRVYAADGELIAEFGEEKRIPVTIDAVPQLLIQAILAAEDHSFYQHHGVDLLGIVRAAWHNVRTGGTGQGASTITMQVARNFFLDPGKTYTRKFKEVLLALKIERELTKPQILELYLNKIFLGHRAYGFAAAAQIYFGTTLDKLTLPEMAMLAGLPKAPSRNNPLTNPQSALERRNYVLKHMHDLGFIDEVTLTEAQAAPSTASKHVFKFATEAPYVGEMVRSYMLAAYNEATYAGGFHVYTTIRSDHQRAANRALHRGLMDYDRRHGYRGPAGRVPRADINDTTKLDDALKDYHVIGELLPGVVTRILENAAEVYTQDGDIVEINWDGLMWARPYVDEDSVGSAPAKPGDVVHAGDIVYLEASEVTAGGITSIQFYLAQVPAVAGALVSLNPYDGAVLALTGGFDFYDSSYNRAIQAKRQPGSSLKPFIYTAALEKGFTAATTISGAPIVIEDAALEHVWRPENYNREFTGPTRLRKALALSLNLVSIRLLRAIGADYTVDYLARFGFDPAHLPRNLSLALGTASATPMQMAAAFAVYANGGSKVEPYFITRIEDGKHNVLMQADPPVACRDCEVTSTTERSAQPSKPRARSPEPARKLAPRVLSPDVNFVATDMLRDVIQYGTAKAALELGRSDLAGKTGTTDDYNDAWFSGFNSSVAATAWIGFDQPTSLGRGEAGGRAALPVWIDYMRVALAGVPDQPPAPTAGVIKVRVNRETGRITNKSDPEGMDEYFVKGLETVTDPITGDGEDAQVPEPAADDVRRGLF